MIEIERKFHLSALPRQLGEITESIFQIQQGYILTENGELRVRQKGEHYYITVKGDGDTCRLEWEEEIPLWVFEILWPHTECKRVNKTRRTMSYMGLTLELDEYHNNLVGLITLECEFSTKEDAAKFTLPPWAKHATEITSNKTYKNKSLAVNGLPK